MTDVRLEEMLNTKRTLLEVIYGYNQQTNKLFQLAGEEIHEIAQELYLLRQRVARTSPDFR